MRRPPFVRLLVLLTLLWMLLFGSFELSFLLMGVLVGFFAIKISRPVVRHAFDDAMFQRYTFLKMRGPGDFFRRLRVFARLWVVYNFELARTNLTMARDVIRAKPDLVPGIYALPVPGLGPVETTVLSNLIGLTPGTIVIDYDQLHEILYIQTIYAHDVEQDKAKLRHLARLICQVTGCQLPESGWESG